MILHIFKYFWRTFYCLLFIFLSSCIPTKLVKMNSLGLKTICFTVYFLSLEMELFDSRMEAERRLLASSRLALLSFFLWANNLA